MKTLLLVVAITSIIFSIDGFSQTSFVYEPYFSAVIVKDVNSSSAWYTSLFALKVKSETDDVQNGYKVVILESDNFLLELLELKGSQPREQLLGGKPRETQIQGHFKIGFKVQDIDACLRRLSQLQIEVPQVWQDKNSQKRNFIVKDPDGNLIQFYD